MKINPHLVEDILDEAEQDENFVVVINPDQTMTIDPEDDQDDGISYTA